MVSVKSKTWPCCRLLALTLIGLLVVLAPEAQSQDKEVAFIGIHCPADTTVGCVDLVPPPDITLVTVETTCPPATVTYLGEVWQPGDNVLVRTWTAVDACGQTSTKSQAITIRDTIPPVISCPPNITVSCLDDVPAPDTSAVVATDDCCTVAEVVFVGDVESPGTCPKFITRTYRVYDKCANSATCQQIITVDDNTPPVLVDAPSDVTVLCGQIPAVPVVTATDNCDLSVIPVFSQSTPPTGCEGSFTRQWIAIDDCGNADTAIQTITVIDNIDPVLVGAPDDITVLCGQIPAAPVVTATDNCDLSVVPVFSESTQPAGCSGSFTRTWIGTDDCGNADTAIQTITVIDNVDPILVGYPSDVTVSCGQIPAPPVVTAIDNCDLSVTPVYSQSTVPAQCGSFMRTWIATDDCGNADTAIQTITVIDDVDPVLVGYPDDITVLCDQIPAPPVVTATDDCDPSVVPVYSQSTIPSGCEGLFTRTWIATDDCGNADTAVQTITVIDNIDPVLVGIPNDVTVACGQIPAPPVVTATDNCDLSVIPVYSQSTLPSGCEGVFTRSWIATDDCGNADTAVQTITVIDNVDPVLVGAPIDVTVHCGQIPAVPVVTATDNCDLSVVPVFSESTPPTDCEGSFTRQWIATDDCGNADTAMQTITVIDNVDPVLVGYPDDITVLCGQIPAPPVVTATDNCDFSVVPVFSESTPPTDCEGSFTRQWIATDDCGNADTAIQIITVIDDVDPVLVGYPDDISVLCGQIPAPPVVTATDNCDLSVIPVFSQSTLPTGCEGSFTRTWIATDDCGNADTAIQIITVIDDVDPVLVGYPDDITVLCGQIPAPPVVTATDNCDLSVVPVFSESTPPTGCEGSFTRQWIATDDCGNADTAIQIITVIDNVDPILVGCPNDTTVNCGDVLADASVTALDNCDLSVEIDFAQSTVPSQCGSFTRTWIATDDCGNADTCIQTVTIIDDVAPVLVGCPDDITVLCNLIPPPALVTATDNCDASVVPVYSESTIPSDCEGTFTRRWIATDDCGNADTCEQIITLIPPPPPFPVIVCPNDTTVSCPTAIPLPTPSLVEVSDGCAPVVEWLGDVVTVAGACDGVVTRTYRAIDTCGFADTCVQVFSISDDIDPVLVDCPNDTTVHCDDIPDAANVTATDNCDTSVVTVLTQSAVPAQCGTFTRRWVATDDCGNADTCMQTITVIDDVDPILVGCPSDTLVRCGPLPPAANVTATDNCDAEVVIVFAETSFKVGDCRSVVRTWIAIDDCGNADTCDQIIKVMDYIRPTLVGCPNDTTVLCGVVPPPAVVTATDDCDTSVVPAFSETIPIDDCALIVRRWIATDGCGNADTCEQIITRQGSSGEICDTLCGTVYNSDCPGTTCLVADAYVQLWDSYPDGSVIYTDTTDASGNFCFDVLPGVEYDIRIYKQGFCTDVLLDAVCGDELVLGLDSIEFVLPESPMFHDFWSTNAQSLGYLIQPGDVIYAVDSNGLIVGVAYVKVAGEYLIHVSGNLPKGPPDLIDEGADPGEYVTFWLNCECPLPAPTGFVNFASTMFDADWTCDPVTVSEINCELCPGWNMFSYNLYLTDYIRESVLTSLELNYDAIRSGMCPAILVSWFEGRPINDLVSVSPWYGYDIHTIAWDTLNLVGTLIPANTPIALCEGWNYVPYYPTEPDSRLHALASIAGNYTNVFNLWCDNFDSYNVTRPEGANDLFCLYPCRGYWIKMTVADTLVYPTDGYDCNEPLAKQVPSYNSGQITGSPIVADFWANADASTASLSTGDIITVRTESGMPVGEGQVGDRGMFLVHVFGDVSSTATIEGAQPGEQLTFEVNGLAASVDGNVTFNDRENSQITIRVSGANPVPAEYSLLQNYPNPFNAGTVIPFTMKDASEWTLTVYNILGQVVRTFEGSDAPGTVNVNWDGQDQNGSAIPSGVYFYRVATESWSATRKMTLLK